MYGLSTKETHFRVISPYLCYLKETQSYPHWAFSDVILPSI